MWPDRRQSGGHATETGAKLPARETPASLQKDQILHPGAAAACAEPLDSLRFLPTALRREHAAPRPPDSDANPSIDGCVPVRGQLSGWPTCCARTRTSLIWLNLAPGRGPFDNLRAAVPDSDPGRAADPGGTGLLLASASVFPAHDRLDAVQGLLLHESRAGSDAVPA